MRAILQDTGNALALLTHNDFSAFFNRIDIYTKTTAKTTTKTTTTDTTASRIQHTLNKLDTTELQRRVHLFQQVR